MENGSEIKWVQSKEDRTKIAIKRSLWSRSILGKIAPYALIFPAMIFLLVFVFIPLIMTFILSLTNWNLISVDFDWVGIENYARLLRDSTFWKVVGNTFMFGGFSVGITVMLSIILAVLLDRKMRGIRYFRSLIFLPYITPMVAVSTLWIWMFDQNFGLINWLLGWIGISPLPWLTQTGWAMAAIIIMKIWKVVGYYTVMLIAGLQNIPEHLYEAARIDGAGERHILLKITLPLLSPYILFVTTVAIIASFQDFDQVFMMTQGGPADSTNMIIYYLYQFGFEFFETGYASSIAVILFIVLFFITWLQFYVSKKWVHYS